MFAKLWGYATMLSFIKWKRVYSPLIDEFCSFFITNPFSIAPAEIISLSLGSPFFHCTSCFPNILPEAFGKN